MRINRRSLLLVLGLLPALWLYGEPALAAQKKAEISRADVEAAVRAMYQESFKFSRDQGKRINPDAVDKLTKTTVKAIQKSLEPKYVLMPLC